MRPLRRLRQATRARFGAIGPASWAFGSTSERLSKPCVSESLMQICELRTRHGDVGALSLQQRRYVTLWLCRRTCVVSKFGRSLSAIARCRAVIVAIAGGLLLTACIEEPPPRSMLEFMEDSIAREGTLVRCNADREETAGDLECINARRAAAALAARADAGKRDELEAQSEARLRAARQRYEAQQAAARQAEVAATAEEQIVYESQWVGEPGVEEPAEQPTITADVAPPPATSAESATIDAASQLEPISLPRSVAPPLTTISLPRSARLKEYEPDKPELEEIVVPNRLK